MTGMPSLPSGTVSLLFSDIEGSTALLTGLGERYADVLDDHRRILRSIWQRHSGIELGTEGDSFYVVFALAEEAVAASIAGQTALTTHPWPEGGGIRVRMGIHTGGPQRHGDAYVGIDVHRAARVAAAVHGGQIVVTDATAALVAGRLPVNATLRDLGRHRFRDLPAPEHLYQVTGAGLRNEFPALRSLGAATGLPADPWPIVGRDDEITRLIDIVSSGRARLVTLTGPGGSGKTRLATAVAAGLAQSHSPQVYFVALDSVVDADSMWSAVARSLALPRGTSSDVVGHLRDATLLLILDNLEQVAGADVVVAELTARAPKVCVLATSRRSLHLRGEHVHPVQPLDLPMDSDPATVARSGAAQLFLQQVLRLRPDFKLDEAGADHIARLCRRLDGLPLALELAAARTRFLSPGALLAGLGSTTDLDDPAADRPLRHHTLRSTIAWSHDQLTEETRRVFRRLSVFCGGATLDAVRQVATDGEDPWPAVSQLAEAALVVLSEGPDLSPRASLLETVRDFALEQLAAAGETDEVRGRHAAFVGELVRSAAGELHTAGDLAARTRLVLEYPNVQEALRWTLRTPQPVPSLRDMSELGVQLCGWLRELWTLPQPEPRPEKWLQRAADLSTLRDSPARAAVLASLGRGRSEADVKEALAISRRLGDPKGAAEALHVLEWFHQDDHTTAAALLDESIALARQADDQLRLSWVLGRRADLCVRTGEYHRALDLVAEVVELAAARGDQRTEVEVQLDLTPPLILLGRTTEARERLDRLLPLALQQREERLLHTFVGCYVATLMAVGEDRGAARIFGAWVASYRRLYGTEPHREDQWWLAGAPSESSRQRLGEEVWREEVATGESMGLEDALRFASC